MRRTNRIFRWLGAIAFVVLLLWPYSSLHAWPVTSSQAEKAVEGWLKTGARPLEMVLGRQIANVETFTDSDGEPIYYIVYLQPAGFVIVSADDLVEPVIGFVAKGTYDPSDDNPLGALVSRDLPGRIAAARDLQTQILRGGPAKKKIPNAKRKAFEKASFNARSKWEKLHNYAERKNNRGVWDFGEKSDDEPIQSMASTPSDVRVYPLVQSQWDQSSPSYSCEDLHCYNYYTPNHYVCGCVATAMAQLMRYHRYPTDGIGVHTFQITVDYDPMWVDTRGGDGAGGPYNWDLMELIPDCDSTEAQREAIGALCYDAGVAAQMSYTEYWSGATMHDATFALWYTFGYSNAVLGGDQWNNIGSGLIGMLNPNLDAGYPALLGITSDALGGHAIVCDGYGYNYSTLYHHVNMGWSGYYDAWYNLPDIAGYFDSVDSCVYNVFTDGSGEIISGRITNIYGYPINGASVTAEASGGGGTYDAMTNSQGIYALAKVPSGLTYTVSVSKTGYYFTEQVVTTGFSHDYANTSGNCWAVDFVGGAGKITLLVPNGGEAWVADGNYDILWDWIGDVGNNVKIELYKGGAYHDTIISSTSNDGLFNWQISSGQSAGSNYRIKISSVSDPDFYYDQSDSDFSILDKPIITTNSPIGGESFALGNSYNITWSSVGAAGDYVDIDLYRAGRLDRSIGVTVNNDGSYNWYIEPNDPNLVLGTGYRVKIKSTSQSCYDYSKSHFSIIEPGITIVSPDGGEFLQRGILYKIKWNSAGSIGDYVNIDLYKADSWDRNIDSSVDNNGSYDWSIPLNVEPGSDYTIKITSTSSPDDYYDFSDTWFTIVEVPWIEQAKLIAPDGAANENFAYFVSIDGDCAIAGAYGDDDNGTDSGSAYILRRDSQSWVQCEKLIASDAASYDYLGCSVAISGDYAIVGSRGDDDNGSNSGSAYIFELGVVCIPELPSCYREHKLTASDGAASDYFGCSVSIDGDYAIVGAYGDDDCGNNSGSAYIFKRIEDVWVEQAKLTADDGASEDLFGYSVSISGDYAIVGAWGSGGSGTGCCAAYIFKRDGENWVQQTKLTAPYGSSAGDFGCSVSISDDYVIVGAHSADGIVSGCGAAYIYKHEDTDWIHQAKLIASDGAADDDFGCSVSINGGYAVVGTRYDSDNGDSSGSAYIFRREDTDWIQQAKITASDGASYDYLGYSVSVSGRGNAIVGAWGDDDNGGSSGSAYVFTALTVLTPNGGESWLRGNKYNITWNSTSSVGSSVKIELLRAGALEKVIASSTANDGSYSWSIPSAQVVSSDYKIEISSTSNPSYYDYSDSYFSISDEVYTRLYVDQSAAGLNDGTSWADAFTELQSALAFALSGQEIWVAEGAYLPDYNVNTATHTGERSTSFDLVSGVAIYGGFPAGGGLWQEHDPNIYETILSGDINTPDDGDNSYHVVTANGTDDTTILDGFVITAGHADDSYPNCKGGGMYNNSGSPKLANCTFISNSAGYLGGGMYNNSGNPRLTNCTFTDNEAIGGSGMYNHNSSPILTNCTFKDNSAGEKGGEGAGMFACQNSSPTLTRCTFSDNSAELYGGGIFAFGNSNPKLISCTFSGNSADRECGGIYNYDSSLTLTNCIIWGNNDGYGEVESAQFKGTSLLKYNCIQNWSGSLGGTGNIGADPLFADASKGDYHLQSAAGRWDPDSESWVKDAATSLCIDAGDPSSDWTAELWPHGKRINMGVHGGTREASMSLSEVGNTADLNNNGFVDNIDMMRFANKWLWQGIFLPEDLDRNGFINFLDFAILADNWLWEE